MSNVDFQRLPKLSLVVLILRRIYKIWGLLAIFSLKLISGERELWLSLVLVLVFLLFTVIPGMVEYFFYGYAITNDGIEIRQGVFKKQALSIPYDRIQALKQKQWFFFEPFNLIQLEIETAGNSNEAEVQIPAIPQEVVEIIQARKAQANLQEADQEMLVSNEPEEFSQEEEEVVATSTLNVQPTYTISMKQILLFSLTDLSMLLSVFVITSFLNRYLSKWYDQAMGTLDKLVSGSLWLVVFVILIVLLIIIFCSFVKGIYLYYDFQVFQDAKELTVERGLLAREKTVIPYSRIQGIEIKQTLLRKIFRLSSVKLLLATGNSDKDENTFYLLPIVADEERTALLQKLLPAWELPSTNFTRNEEPKLWYFIRYNLFIGLILGIGLGYFLTWWLTLAVAIFAAFLIAGDIWKAHVQGFQILSNHFLAVETVFGITRTQSILVRNKVQALTCKTSRWLVPKHLGQLELTIKAGNNSQTIALKFIPLAFQKVLATWYLPESKQTNLLSDIKNRSL